jgi:predicted tellurium resistance membrane protein TerC
VKLMHHFHFLETCAFLVIAILGVKLLMSIPRHFLDEGHPVHIVLASKYFDLGTSALTLLVFLVPVAVHLMRKRFNRSSQ